MSIGKDIYKPNERILDEDIDYCVERPFMGYYNRKNILIIGVSGMIGAYIGRVFSRYYRTHEGTVSGMCRNLIKAKKALDKDSENIFTIMGDISNKKSFNIERKYDVVIFAAGYTDKKICDSMPDSIYKVNTEGLINALNLAKRICADRFLFLSSAAVYGMVEAERLNESDYGIIEFCNPNQVYAQSKRMAECICNCYSKQYNLDVRILRPFHMYGPGMVLNNSNLVSSSVRNVIKGKNIVLKTTGLAIRNMSYLRDMISYIILIGATESRNITVNLGSKGNDISVCDWAELLADSGRVCLDRPIIDSKDYNQIDNMSPFLKKQEELMSVYDKEAENMNVRQGVIRMLNYFMGGNSFI